MIRNHYNKRKNLRPYQLILIMFLGLGILVFDVFILSPDRWYIEVGAILALGMILFSVCQLITKKYLVSGVICGSLLTLLLLQRFELLSVWTFAGLLLVVALIWYLH